MLSHPGHMTASVMYCYHTNGSYNYPQMQWFKIAIIFHESAGWLTSLTSVVCWQIGWSRMILSEMSLLSTVSAAAC